MKIQKVNREWEIENKYVNEKRKNGTPEQWNGGECSFHFAVHISRRTFSGLTTQREKKHFLFFPKSAFDSPTSGKHQQTTRRLFFFLSRQFFGMLPHHQRRLCRRQWHIDSLDRAWRTHKTQYATRFFAAGRRFNGHSVLCVCVCRPLWCRINIYAKQTAKVLKAQDIICN